MRPLSEIKGVGPKTLEKLNALGIGDSESLVNFFPVNYIDLDSVSDLEGAGDGVFVLLSLTISSVSKPFRKGKLTVFKASGKTGEGKTVKLVWYNMPYAAKTVAVGASIRCYGKLKTDKGYILNNPVFEAADGESRFKGVKPVYPLKGLIRQAVFSEIVKDALKDFRAESVIGPFAEAARGLMPLPEAYVSMHAPENIASAAAAKERVTLEETVRRICAYRLIREKGIRYVHYGAGYSDLTPLYAALPYELTPSQKEAVKSLVNIMKSDKPLNAMLTGDVGSGKTVVALICAYFAVMSKKQAAIMAPTEILALQHYKTFSNILEPLGVKTELLLGSMPAAGKRAVRTRLLTGDTGIIIGTHAVISKGVEFFDLGLAVIDEQHRFGVAQRTALLDKSQNADTLTLSATPIPRSLRLTMFNDIDIINIDRRFDNANIITAVVGKGKRKAMLDYIAAECGKGKQAYIVAPRIFDDEGLETDAAERLYKELNTAYGKDLGVILMHGRMKSAEKKAALDAFSENRAKIMVSTSVIEVGIDVKNASLMAVFNAEMFGLAALHQLRGRIGRDGKRAYCFLYTEKENEDELVRLRILAEERDGLKIAERDYELRGAGDWLGESQSGKTGFHPTVRLMKVAKEVADTVDAEKHYNLLERYANRLELEKISLN